MNVSDHEDPDKSETAADGAEPGDRAAEAQQAADGLKDQIAAIRARVRAAKQDLSDPTGKRGTRRFSG